MKLNIKQLKAMIKEQMEEQGSYWSREADRKQYAAEEEEKKKKKEKNKGKKQQKAAPLSDEEWERRQLELARFLKKKKGTYVGADSERFDEWERLTANLGRKGAQKPVPPVNPERQFEKEFDRLVYVGDITEAKEKLFQACKDGVISFAMFDECIDTINRSSGSDW